LRRQPIKHFPQSIVFQIAGQENCPVTVFDHQHDTVLVVGLEMLAGSRMQHADGDIAIEHQSITCETRTDRHIGRCE
jgi:hypothetical protein